MLTFTTITQYVVYNVGTKLVWLDLKLSIDHRPLCRELSDTFNNFWSIENKLVLLLGYLSRCGHFFTVTALLKHISVKVTNTFQQINASSYGGQ